MAEEDSIRDDIMKALNKDMEEAEKDLPEEPEDKLTEEPVEHQESQEPAPKVDEEPKTDEPKEVAKAPDSWSGEAKELYSELPPRVRQEIEKRESDFHKAMTRHDGDLNFGREVKEIVNPYLPLMHAENAKPQDAIREMLNISYVLRTGSPEQKIELLRNTCNQFGIDPTQLGVEESYVDPEIQAMRDKIARLEQQSSPEAINRQLQSRQEIDKVQGEVNAFASDPANIHFDMLRPQVAALLQSGQAKGLKEAYDMACWGNPEIRAKLLETQRQQEQAKKTEELRAKQKAASSITGSSAGSASNASSPPENESLRDTIERAWRELSADSI